MTTLTTLPAIARAQDEKIRAYLAGGKPQQFWYAHCPLDGTREEQFARLHALGFDNYPTAHIPAIDALHVYLFFFERLLGSELHYVDGPRDFFHTWCRPLIRHPEEVAQLTIALDDSPLWQAYAAGIGDYLRATPAAERLPVMFPGLSPLDMAANLCGAEQLFLLLYEAPDAAARLLDTIVTVQVEVYRRLWALGTRIVNPHGFPGVYANDLQLPSLSPAHIADLIVPRYARIAAACGGLVCCLLSSDARLLPTLLRMEGLIGCAFDKTLPLAEIKQYLDNKLFVIANYIYDDRFDAPTYHDGFYCNPIVQAYSRELTQVYHAFAATHSLLISIERPSLAEICADRQALREGIQGRDGELSR